MFPITKPELSFGEISKYWAPELRWSRDMVQALLEGAWWLGEITDASSISPLEFLKRLFTRMRNCDAAALLFVTPQSPPPAETIELVDVRPRVFVPSDNTDMWTEASCMDALRAMVEIPSLEYYSECSPGFSARKLTSDKFFKWIAVRGFPCPTFWKRASETTSLTLKSASEQRMVDAVRRVYDIADEEGKKPPNIKQVAKPVQGLLKENGYQASAKQIQEIAERPEFKKRRRPPGRTLSSERRRPRE
jgi:hypothetical protein